MESLCIWVVDLSCLTNIYCGLNGVIGKGFFAYKCNFLIALDDGGDKHASDLGLKCPKSS